MSSDKRISIMQSEIIKAMQESLTGSVTFHFNAGILMSVHKTSHVKTSVDDMDT